MDVDLAPILFVLMVSITAVQSQITKGPTNALKKVGDNVTLECVTSRKNCDDLQWSKMEEAQSLLVVYRHGNGMLNSDAFPTQRYSVSSSGGCSLTITQLQINDSGRFRCVTLTAGGREPIRRSVLVVISVGEACRSNVTSNELARGDSYSFTTAINVPAKSVEPSNVILSFQNKADDETETMDESQSQTVKTTLTGIAREEDITQRVCRASLPPNSADGFDRSTATLDVCTTQQVIMLYPVEKIAVSPSSPYHKGDSVLCTADGRLFPTFKWTHLKSGDVVDDDTLVINGEDGDEYTCTATNTIKGKATSQSRTIEVFTPPQPPSDRASIGSIGIGVGVGVGLLVLGGIIFAVLCKRYKCVKRAKTDDKTTNGNDKDSEMSRFNREDSHASQYEPVNVLLSQNSDAGPTYEELTIPTEVDATGQSVSSRAILERTK